LKRSFKILLSSAGLILIIALYLALLVLNIPFLIWHIYKRPKGLRNEYFHEWVYNTMFSIDQNGNATFYPIWNSLWVKDDFIYPFGNADQTISHVLGWNRTFNNLTWFGYSFGLLINFVFRRFLGQKDHLEESK
jgi:hypothetical protein